MRAQAARGGVEYIKGCQGIPINLHMLKGLAFFGISPLSFGDLKVETTSHSFGPLI